MRTRLKPSKTNGGQHETLRKVHPPGQAEGPTKNGELDERGQCEALHSPGIPGMTLPWTARRSMSQGIRENERAAALSFSLRDFFDTLGGRLKNFMRFYHGAFLMFLRREASIQPRETFGSPS